LQQLALGDLAPQGRISKRGGLTKKKPRQLGARLFVRATD
jgi:hypothetical protein